ncbi:hypothetical protein JYU21_02645 [Alkaliphilus sp. AH-315-G20]|nr:hypothetical protein [Alkaliphilus sp. AH-315-G20]
MILGTTIAVEMMVVPFLGQNFRLIAKRTVPISYLLVILCLRHQINENNCKSVAFVDACRNLLNNCSGQIHKK